MSARADSHIVIDYHSPGVGEYDNNLSAVQSSDAALQSEEGALEAIVAAAAIGARIRVDISSMRRSTIASVVDRLQAVSGQADVQFVYAPAAYEASARAAVDHLSLSAGPVSDVFRGDLRPSSLPIGLVAGLGLEPHRIMGLTELLEPDEVWAFIASSDDARFQLAARQVNQLTLDDVHTTPVVYDIRSIAETYLAVDSLVFAAAPRRRLVLAPSGPKMFALVCLLVASNQAEHRPAVWRVGPISTAEATGLEAAGDVVAAEVNFRA
ncbi:hypothetical protein [Plantibacter sp. MPB07]|uniref:hypothetical protein n=1 Tax=Plantibacter sp. MPB07 TaxID=3388853 RepID=UPI00398764CF